MAVRRLRLKRPDNCVVCAVALPAGTLAVWDASARTVTCIGCSETVAPPSEPPSPLSHSGDDLDRGKPGSSAAREYERRRSAREHRARDKLGRLSGVYLAVSTEPQPQVSWARGSAGEKLLGESLEKLHDGTRVFVLHDRRIPGTKANIDHIVITAAGEIWAIDAKNYQGKVQRIDQGGWFKSDERLYVGRRDCTRLVTSMSKQTDAVRTALGEEMITEFEVQLRAALCFVNAEWSLFARPMSFNSVWVGWGKALRERVQAPTAHLDPEHVLLLAQRVATALPSA